MAYMEPFGVTGPTGVQELDRLVREEHIYRYSQPTPSGDILPFLTRGD